MDLRNKKLDTVEEIARNYADIFKIKPDKIKNNEYSIVLCGNYGATNIGDDAIMLSIIKILNEIGKRVVPDIKIKLTILSYDIELTKNLLKKHNIESEERFTINIRHLMPLGVRTFIRGVFKGEMFRTMKCIKESDMFILGGGGLFSDEEGKYALFLWAWQVYFAFKYKIKTVMFGQSIQVSSEFGKKIVKWSYSKSQIIHVRDIETSKFLQKLGINIEISVDNDIVFRFPVLYSGQLKENSAIGEKLHKKIVQNRWEGYFIVNFREVSIREQVLCKNIVQKVFAIINDLSLLPVFIPFQLHNGSDSEFLYKILEQTKERFEIVELENCTYEDGVNKIMIQEFNDNLFEILSIFKKSDRLLGVRLHSLVFAKIMDVKFDTLPYSKKVESFLNSIES